MTNTDQARPAPWGNRRRQEPRQSEADLDAIRRTEAATGDIEGDHTMNGNGLMEQNAGAREQKPEDDPAPTAAAVAEERAQHLVANITTAAQSELRGLRDQLDEVIRDLGERRTMLTDAIRSHAEFAQAAIQHKIIIGESIAKLQSEFEKSRTPLPPPRNV